MGKKSTAHHRQEQRDILELSPNDDRPFRIDDMMHDRPEETADAKSEEEDETKEPGKAELDRRTIGTDEAKNETDDANHAAEKRQPGEAALFKIFAFRRGQDVGSIAHFFSGSAFFSRSA